MTFPIHLISMLRMCGAVTQSTGQNTNFNVNNLLASVQGDTDSHSGLGALIPQSGANFFINNKRAIASIVDGANPDIQGITPHVSGLPIPMQGSPNFFIGQGSGGGGLGMMQQLGIGNFGGLNVGELVSAGGQIIGQVSSFTSLGGGAGVAQLSNMQGTPITPGTTVTGQTSGRSFTFSNFFDTRIQTGANSYPSVDTISTNALSLDDGQYIVIEDYYNLYPTLNLTASVITA